MPNHLAGENSPYLLQHVDNPVDWYPWGPEAFEKARREDKPIFLSIGYAACHWCHVMAHESFENLQTAAIMNQNFVNIKVDREERPDLDGIYMQAVTALTGSGGWPMSVFLTPEGHPFYGGTYFPPTPRYQMPSFPELLQAIARLWQEDRQKLLTSAQQLQEHLQTSQIHNQGNAALADELLTQASAHLSETYDWRNGGWGNAPKFPQPMAIEFLLQRASRGNQTPLKIAKHALDSMAQGGMYDVVGGGFARYSTDDRWLTPHFEKMLYDNAQLARAYLHAFLLSGDDFFRQVCEETLDFIHRELQATLESGVGFFSSLDADSEGVEGKFYTWTYTELIQAMSHLASGQTNPANFDIMSFFKAVYNLQKEGNFEGKIILQRSASWDELEKRLKMPADEIRRRLTEIHQFLRKLREQRPRPGCDDKVLTSWNGLTLQVFAEAARYLQRQDYLKIARQNASFLLKNLYSGGRLLRSWRKGHAQHNAYLEDYASLALGLLALYQSDPDPTWFKAALGLAQEMATHFSDPNGGFFDTRDDHEALLLRPKDIQDNATPSGNALACQLLLELAAFTGDGDYRDRAEKMLQGVASLAIRYPTSFARWLCTLDFALAPVKEVAILGDADVPETRAMLEAVWSGYRPHLVLAQSTYPPTDESPALLHERPLLNKKTTAYVCQGFACLQPVNTVEALLHQIQTPQKS